MDALEQRGGWEWRSVGIVVLAWLTLQFSGIFTPGLLDDVDSIYLEIAREMLHRNDFVTPYIDGIRFFDKPPLMYWMAAGSMRIFGEYDWAARLPLALAVLALLASVYALGLRLFQDVSPARAPDRGALYAALAMATSIGPYLYTRFFIPDILICLWMTLGVHCFLVAVERAREPKRKRGRDGEREAAPAVDRKSPLLPALGFGAVLALNLLSKGLIGVVFPLVFVVAYLVLTRQIKLLAKLQVLPSMMVFLVIALPWHLLAALRNPAIAMPSGLDLPEKAGWAWFYLYNEHVGRFLGQRIPHDYGVTPVWLFLLYALLWMMPWTTFLPATVAPLRRALRTVMARRTASGPRLEAALILPLWAATVLLFFCVSSRQEYYSLPAMPALALLAGGLLARAEFSPLGLRDADANRHALACHRWFLLPLACLVMVTCAVFAIFAPRSAEGADLASVLSVNPELYNLSLGHIFDLTGNAMGFFRGPLGWVAIGMAVIGPASYTLRRKSMTYVANLTLAAGMMVVLLAAHQGLVVFNPILGSKGLALAIVKEQTAHPEAGDLIVIDGEMTAGSTLPFYTRQQVHLVNGRVNTLWFGSFWPDAPKIFEDERSLQVLWQGPRRVFLLTPSKSARAHGLEQLAAVKTLAEEGGKSVIVNR